MEARFIEINGGWLALSTIVRAEYYPASVEPPSPAQIYLTLTTNEERKFEGIAAERLRSALSRQSYVA